MTLRHLAKTFIALALGGLLSAPAAGAVGFQEALAPDPDGPAIPLAIWYPSDAPAAASPIGAFEQVVATNGAPSGQGLPLVIFSHGTGGSGANSFDTAIALAKAGFVVAALTHPGDNYRDQALSFTWRNFANRPRQVSRAIDFLLGAWPGRTQLDAERIGILGHSAGGTTALIAGGGRLDWSKIVAFCRDNPEDWGCKAARQRAAGKDPDADQPVEITGFDRRLKAILVAAPALAPGFAPDGLAEISVPVALWVGGRDAIVPGDASVGALLARPPETHLVANAGHFAFLAPCNDFLAARAPEICADPEGFDRRVFLGDFQQAAIDFFRRHLR